MPLPIGFALLAIVAQFVFLIGVYWAYREKPNVAVVFLVTMIVSAAWMLGTFAAAAKGKLSFATHPPTMLVIFLGVFILAFGVGFSRFGKQLAAELPLATLVGFQAFRFPLELLLHEAYREGLMPVQMSYSGRNFDIVTGITAALVGLLLWKRSLPRWVVQAWNVMGILLLANVLTIAFLSTPLPIRRFFNEPANVWIKDAPYVWLPAVFVLLAIMGHVVITRRLLGADPPGID
jgi:hypothetical protein